MWQALRTHWQLSRALVRHRSPLSRPVRTMAGLVLTHPIPGGAGPNGETELAYSFVSEPLGLPAELGYGFAQLRFNDSIGPEKRYTIVRKLGWGMHSSIWLARDARTASFVAVKVLTGAMTGPVLAGDRYEPDALQALADPTPSPHCPRLLDRFTTPRSGSGSGSPGEHICLAMPLYGGDVKALRKAEDAPFGLPLAKRILLHIVRALAHAHSRNVIHTDIKMDNVFFTTSLSSADIERLLLQDPSRYHPPEKSLEGTVQAAVSQPLPVISRDDALRATFLLADFGLSQPVLVHPPCTITAAPLRAPEVFLGAHWDAPADIWSLGVLAYDLITSHRLFKYQPNDKWGLTEDENMLYQMMCLTGEDFEPPQLQTSPLAPDFFSADCELKKKPKLVRFLFENSVPAYGNVDKADVPAIANFLRRCLHLNPHERATANDLLSDPLFADVP